MKTLAQTTPEKDAHPLLWLWEGWSRFWFSPADPKPLGLIRLCAGLIIFYVHLAYTPDPLPEAGHFFRSDHFSMAKRGVPAISFESGNDWVDGGVEAGKKAEEDYTTNRYHQPGDEWDPKWPFSGVARDLEVLYSVGHDLANSKEWPNWSADSEFRAIRDRSASARK